MRRLGLDLPVRFAPYNQVFQQLLDPPSLLAQNRGGINVVLVRFEDWVRFRTRRAPESGEPRGERPLSGFLPAPGGGVFLLPAAGFRLSLVPRLSRRTRTGPPSPAAHDEAHRNQPARPGERALHLAGRARRSLSGEPEPHDPHGDELGHIPYTPEYFTALGSLLSRKIHALRLMPYKVIALDCDDTLWQGICGEDGPEEVIAAAAALQEFMVAQHDAGMLLCLCSKNNEEDVLETFRCSSRICPCGWSTSSPSASIGRRNRPISRHSAEELQLGLDSFIFVDDNPQECAEVQAGASRSPHPPASRRPEARSRTFSSTSGLSTACRSPKRTSAARNSTASGSSAPGWRSRPRPWESSSPRSSSRPASRRLLPEQLARVAQLTQRTNQMNFTTVRRTEADIQALLRSGYGRVPDRRSERPLRRATASPVWRSVESGPDALPSIRSF